MKKFVLIIALHLVTINSFGQNTNNRVTIIQNTNIFTGEEYLEHTNLVFNDSIIIEITKDITKYKTPELIDGSNKTIIPPLVNAHVHIWNPSAMKQSLKEGIFVNLDMHNTDERANYLRSFNDSLNYSTFYSSNAAATVKGGHGTQFGIQVPIIDSTNTPEKFVQDRIAANADYIKIIKESTMNTLNNEQTLEVIETAHQNNLMAVGHSHKMNDSKVLAEQGIDGMMHIWFDKPAEQNTLIEMKEQGIFIVPTLLVTQKVLEMGLEQGWAQYVLSFDQVLEEINKAYQAGIPILCGTDPPNLNVNFTDNLFDEMVLLSQAGLPNIEILKSASTNTYKAFNLEYTVLKKGALANFVLVNGNPIDNISELKLEKLVFKKGKIIE